MGLRTGAALLLQSRRASWWVRLIARAGVTSLSVLLCSSSSRTSAPRGKIPNSPLPHPGWSFWDRFLLDWLLRVSATGPCRALSRLSGASSVRTGQSWRPGRGLWSRSASPGTFFLWGFLVGVVLRILREVFSMHPVSVFDIGWWCLTTSVPLALAIWAFVARRDQQLEVFETALPPELRLVVDLHRRAEAFRDRAQALEQAMEEATSISEQVHRGIELERQQLAELHEQYLRQARLNELTPEQATAVAELLGRQQARNAGGPCGPTSRSGSCSTPLVC